MRDIIFLSHAHEDKDLVSNIAEELRQTFGEDKIFYDSWSMKPGDSLVGGMSKGLERCSHFFLFMSAISLQKPMVRLEWHNALMSSLKSESNFIPIRIDNISPPEILTTTLYLDMYNRGLPQTINDIKQLVHGNGLYNPKELKKFSNLSVKFEKKKEDLKISVLAKKLVEPVNRFGFWLSDGKSPVANGFSQSCDATIKKGNSEKKLIVIEQSQAITPGNNQEYFIKKPSDKFEIEIYHIPTQNKAEMIYSGSINLEDV